MNTDPMRPRTVPMSVLVILVGLITFVSGLFWGLSRRESSHYVVSDIDPEFRKKEVEPLFSKFLEKRILYQTKLKVNQCCNFDVDIVDDSSRGADYGFVTLDVPVANFWIVGNGYEIYKYDNDHLFVKISDWYINKMKRDE